MLLSIIIINYNGLEFIPDCITSIRKFAPGEHEIIIVDNASRDGSVAYLKKNHPDVKLIVNKSNLGFAKGNNLGAGYASGKYILLLNNDTLLLNDISDVFTFLDKHDDIGALGLKMLGMNGEYRFSAGHFPSPFRLLKFSSLYKKDGFFRNGNFPFDGNVYYPVDWIEGSFLLTRSFLWEMIDGLDEGYFMYLEDVDYCRRLQDLGYKSVYFPAVPYLHFGGYNPTRTVMLIKGFRRYHDKFSGLMKRWTANIILTAGLLLRIFCFYPLSLSGKKSIKNKADASLNAFWKSPW